MTLQPGTPEQAGMSASRVQHVRDLAESWVTDGKTPSLIVLAARRGKIILHEAFGQLTPDADSPPLQRDSIFPVASLSKPIVATLAMMLVEDGLLGLNRPVSDYIPEFGGEGKDDVLVHHLLTHTSGLDDDEITEASNVDINDIKSLPQFEDSPHPVIKELSPEFFDVPLSQPPGEEMYYSNMGYELLGDIIRTVSGQSLSDFAQHRLFEPLGMSDSSFVLPESARHRLLRRSESAPVHALLEWAIDIPLAMGGVCSTAFDIAIFCQMFLDGGTYDDTRILSPASVAAMTRNQTPGIPTTLHGTRRLESSWGYGWMIRGNETWAYQPSTLMSPETYRHGGAGGTYMWADPVNDLVGI